MTGDVLLHNTLWQVARRDAHEAGRPPGAMDFYPMFRPLRGLLSGADLAICHLETPLGRATGPFSSYPLFEVPPQVAAGLRQAGFDACTTASNHSVDRGQDGLRHTLDVLDRARLEHTGTARSRREQMTPTIIDVAGVRVAVLSYTYSTNGMPVPADRTWSVNLIDPGRIRADARRAKKAGADVVLVALHWGEEYRSEPSAYQLRVAREVTRSRHVDLVYGHHAHVVQPVRRIHGTWVAFGLGNLVAHQPTTIAGVYDGLAAEFDLVVKPSGAVSVRYAGYRPTYITPYGAAHRAMRVIDLEAALHADHVPAWLRSDLLAARDRVAARVGRMPRR
jgi:poly-gamma-glutamate synthesis protein (capsule biosynthesis protein)